MMENKRLSRVRRSLLISVRRGCAKYRLARRTIGKTTYVVSLRFKETGQIFAQKLKRVLKADCNA